MNKELKALDYFIALGQTCLMQSKNYKNNEVVMLENEEKYRTQELANITAYYLNSYENQKHNIELLKEENKTLRESNKNLDETYYGIWQVCEELKKNNDYALMFIDDVYCLVDTKDNKFEVIKTYELK